MKFKIFLSLIAFATTAAFAQPAAHADSPRFKFPANYYKIEEPTMPRSSYIPPAAPTVRSGSTPSASSMLGIPLAHLKKPAPVQAAPAQQPNVMAQLMPQGFKDVFGKPAAPAVPMTATPQSMAPVAKAAAAPMRPSSAPRIAHSQNLAGRMRRPSYPASRVAHAAPIQTYGSGYVPGNTAPSAFGNSSSTSTSVSAVLHHK